MLRPPLAAYGERLGDRRRLPFFSEVDPTKTKRRHGVTRRGGSLWPWRRGRRSCSRVIQYACATMRAGRCRQLVRVCRLANRALCRWPRREAKEYWPRHRVSSTVLERRYDESDVGVRASRSVGHSHDIRGYYQRSLHCCGVDFRSMDASRLRMRESQQS